MVPKCLRSEVSVHRVLDWQTNGVVRAACPRVWADEEEREREIAG